MLSTPKWKLFGSALSWPALLAVLAACASGPIAPQSALEGDDLLRAVSAKEAGPRAAAYRPSEGVGPRLEERALLVKEADWDKEDFDFTAQMEAGAPPLEAKAAPASSYFRTPVQEARDPARMPESAPPRKALFSEVSAGPPRTGWHAADLASAKRPAKEDGALDGAFRIGIWARASLLVGEKKAALSAYEENLIRSRAPPS